MASSKNINVAYHISTGNYLTKQFSCAEFQRIKTENWLLESSEYADPRSVEADIAGLASLIEAALDKKDSDAH